MNQLLLPVAAAQGRWLRSTRKLAAPPGGPTSGTAGTTTRPPLSIAVVGDSTAAGSGVASLEDGFAACLARELSGRTRRPVRWQVSGQFGATARRIRFRLVPEVDEDLDLAVLLAGANDVLAGRSVDDWQDDLAATVDALMARAAHVVVAGLPPFALFPAMPAVLGRLLTERAAALDEASQRICAARPGSTWVTMPGSPPPGFFAADRFHPSAAGYHLWAAVIADHITL
jgi:lysophospholipase L1-like esterase